MGERLSRLDGFNPRSIAGDISAQRAHRERLALTNSRTSGHQPHAIAFIVEKDPALRFQMRQALEHRVDAIAAFATVEAFVGAYQAADVGCVVFDAFMPGAGGTDVLLRLKTLAPDLPVIVLTGYGGVKAAVEAMRRGAFDLLEKPVQNEALVAAVSRAVVASRRMRATRLERKPTASGLASLTNRQAQVLTRILAGAANKMIAIELGISQRTVENHRATIMEKTQARSVPELTRMAVAAHWSGI